MNVFVLICRRGLRAELDVLRALLDEGLRGPQCHEVPGLELGQHSPWHAA